MKMFIKDDNPFRLGVLDSVPTAGENECILLYREATKILDCMTIFQGVSVSFAGIRHKHYDRKITVSLLSQELKFNYDILMEKIYFKFKVSITIDCSVQDVKKYYFNEKIDRNDIELVIRNIIKQYEGVYDIQSGLVLKNKIEDDLHRKLGYYEAIKFLVKAVDVEPDAKAQEIMDSTIKKIVATSVNRNEADISIDRNVQNVRVLQSETNLKAEKMKQLAIMLKCFGPLASVMEDYFNGKMDGRQLYEYIQKMNNEKLNFVIKAIQNDALTVDEGANTIKKLLGDSHLDTPNLAVQELSDNNFLSENDYSNLLSFNDGDII